MRTERWRIQLLGELRATLSHQTVTRFYTHKIGGLFAWLALYPERAHPREELIERFWPDADLELGRISLRTALVSLRRQLEPPGIASGSVLFADRSSVRLLPEAFTTDVADFERNLRDAPAAVSLQEQSAFLEQTAALYRGDLLPGYYDEWVLQERERLMVMRFAVLHTLCTALGQQGSYGAALEYARCLVQANPLDEEAHIDLIRLYAAAGQLSAARRHYQDFERILRIELATRPAATLQAILEESHYLPQATLPDRESDAEALPEPTVVAASLSPPELSLPPLPAPFTPFFGREEDIAHVRVRLHTQNTRMVTLTGLGGTGKTRLALEIARRERESGNQAVCFVPLADVDAPHLISEAVCSALHLDAGRANPLDQVVQALQNRPALLVLDNFEQLVLEQHQAEVGTAVVRELLERLPALACLITSRRRLGLMGEWEFPVAPLPTPSAPGTLEHLMEFPSVQLFVSRAQAARPDFQITSTTAQAVAQLCHTLDGLPLALELAAARAPVLTPAQMLQQVTNRFGFLVARHRDAVERHKTLRTAIEWSYQSLSSPLQSFLSRLSVFRGGWNLTAAEAVCEEPDALDCLMDLRDASLVSAEERDGEMRFRMLETVREYALERLTESGKEAETRQQHLHYYLGIAEEHDWGSTGQAYIQWREHVVADYENIRTAISWSLRKEHWEWRGETEEAPSSADRRPSSAEVALRLTGSLGAYWILSSHYREGLEWLRRAIAVARETSEPVRDAVWAVALMSAGYVAFVANEFDAARSDAEEGLAFARKAGDRIQQIQCLAILAQLPAEPNDPDRALRVLEEAQAIARQTRNPRKIAFVQYVLGRVSYLRGEEERALQTLEQALNLSRSTKDGNMIAHTAANLACLALCRGDVDLARALSVEALEAYNAQGFSDTRGFNGIVLSVQAFIAVLEGNLARARDMFLHEMRTGLEVSDKHLAPNILVGLAMVAYASDHCEQAAALLGAAAKRYQELGFEPEPMEKSFRDRTLPEIQERLGTERFMSAWTRGGVWRSEEMYRHLLEEEIQLPS